MTRKTHKVASRLIFLFACTYIGSAISTYGIALLSEMIGWRYTVFLWFVIAASGGILCLLCIPQWNKK